MALSLIQQVLPLGTCTTNNKLSPLVQLLPVGGVVEVGEERVRKKVVVNTVKVNAQNLQDYFLLFQKQVVGETNWPRSMHSTSSIFIVIFVI